MTGPVEDRQSEEVNGQARAQTASFRPWVTYTLLGVTILVFIVQYLSETVLGIDLLVAYGAKINQWIDAGEIWRLVTPVFLHAGLLHILFNMYALFAIGPALERFYGHERYTLLYFLSGISGNVVSYYLSPNASVGASTALFGLVAGEAVFIFRNREFFGGQARGMLANVAMIVVVNLMLGLSSSGIDNWGHLGGLLGGLAFAWSSGPLLSMKWLESGGYALANRVSTRTARVFALIQALVLVGLVVLRVLSKA